MYAHSHNEYFNIVKDNAGNSLLVSVVNPSATTLFNVNPSFRVYEMDPNSYEILDFIDYRLNVTKSNEERKAHWYEALRFTEYFKVPSMSAHTVNHIIQRATVSSST